MRLFIFSLMLAVLTAGPALAAELSLPDCLAMARRHNPTLTSAAHNTTIAREAMVQAKSGYLPKVDLDAGYRAQNNAQSAKVAGGATMQTQNQNFPYLDVGAEQVLYDFGRTKNLLTQAKDVARATSYNYANLEQGIFLRTVTAYYQILTIEKLQKAASEEVKQMTEHLRIARDLYDQGMVTRNDVLQAQVKLAGSKQLLLSRQNQFENSWRTLDYLIGRPATARGTLEETLQKEPEAAPPAKAVAHRPDLKAQQLLVAKSAAAVKSSRSDYYPVLFLRGDINYLKNDYVTQQTIYSATIGLKVNLFDGNVTTSRLRQAVQEETRDRDRLRDLQDQAVLEYQNARNDAQVAHQRIAVAAQAIKQAEENLRINENRYRENVGTGTDVIDAQTLLTQTRTDYDQALFDYQVAIARIKKAAGEL